MKKVFQVSLILICFMLNRAMAQGRIEEVVIHGSPTSWKPWQPGTGGGATGAEPSEKELARYETPGRKPKPSNSKKSPGNAHTKIKSMSKFNKWLAAADWLYNKATELGKNATITMDSNHVLDYNGNIIDSNSRFTISSFFDSGILHFKVEFTDSNGEKGWAIFAGSGAGN